MARPYKYRRELPVPPGKFQAGVYAILNSVNGKIYIGSSVRMRHRWTEHRCELEDGVHDNQYLQRAFRKEPSAFYVEVIEELYKPDKNALLAREQFWIHFFRSWIPQNGYNIAPKAESCQGIVRSEEFRRKMSLAGRQPWSRERKEAWKEIRRRTQPRGWKLTEGQKLKLSLSHMGIKQTEGTVEKRLQKLRGRKYPQKGRPVIQLSSTGEILKRYEAIAYAAKELGVPECNIRQCCKHATWTSGGFRWRDANGQ